MPGVPTVRTMWGFPKGKQRLRDHTQPGVPLEAGARGGAQPKLSAGNMGLSAASLFLSLLFIPKINCFLFQSPAKPDDGSSFRACRFNSILLFPLLSLPQSFNLGLNQILILHFAFKMHSTKQQHLAFPTVVCIPPVLLPQNQIPALFTWAGLCNRQTVTLHQVTEGIVSGGIF